MKKASLGETFRGISKPRDEEEEGFQGQRVPKGIISFHRAV